MGRDRCTDSKILALMQPQKTEKRWNHTFPPFLCFCGYIRARIFQSVRFCTVYSWGCRDLIQVLSCWLLLLHSNNTWIFESVGLWFLLLHSIQFGCIDCTLVLVLYWMYTCTGSDQNKQSWRRCKNMGDPVVGVLVLRREHLQFQINLEFIQWLTYREAIWILCSNKNHNPVRVLILNTAK